MGAPRWDTEEGVVGGRKERVWVVVRILPRSVEVPLIGLRWCDFGVPDVRVARRI